MRLFAVLLTVVVGCPALPVFANVLPFTGSACSANSAGTGAFVACGNGTPINQAYGDAAGVDVTYKDLINVGNSLKWWGAGYSNLPDAVWGGNGDATGLSFDRIEIAPTAGGTITLNAFDMGAWPNAQLTTHLQVLDRLTNAVLFDMGGGVTIGTGGVATHFSPGVSSANGVAIQWKDTGFNVGIDNIDFNVRGGTSIPEPTTFGLVTVCLTLLGTKIRSSTKRA